MAAALAIVSHAPHTVQPALQAIAFTAFSSGLRVACVAGAGVAVVGALVASRLLPGRGAAEVEVAQDLEACRCDLALASAPAPAPA